jgi:hypothetical protein
MNYSVEENIDFYNELNKEDDISPINTCCMLTHQPLSENYITLPCKHTFNYIPLYHEVSTKFINNHYDTKKLNNNEIKCPYCRTKYDKLLPYIEYVGIEKKHGVNWPEKESMKHMNCGWLYKSGKNKGEPCSKNGFIKGTKIYCYIHWMTVEDSLIDAWNNEMETLFKTNTIIGLKKILKNNNLLVSGTKKILVKRIIESKINYL